MPGLILQRTPLRTDDGYDRLERRERAKFRVGDDVIITILAIDRNQVRVHIEAPRNVPILREEIYERSRRLAAADVDGNRSALDCRAPKPYS